MSINKLNILHRGGTKKLPDWISFAFGLGSYIYDYGLESKSPVSIVLSVPNERYIPLFIAMGIADRVYSIDKDKNSIRSQILDLKPGSRIIYQGKTSARRVSVISVEPSPVFKNEMILNIQDGTIDKRGIPEKEWIRRITILDEELTDVKRSRKISEKQNIGLENNPLLSELYSPQQLNKISFYPGHYFYLVGNTAQNNEDIYNNIFSYKDVYGGIKDFVYLDSSNSGYTNSKLFSSRIKKNEVQINDEVPVIYTDINSYIKHSNYFINNPKIIVFNRNDNESRLSDFR